MSEPWPRQRRTDAHLRASDDERDRTAAQLADALAVGRIDTDEHAQRLEAAFAARTRGELAPLTADLPEPGAHPAPPADSEPVTTLFGKVRRSGQWPVPPHTAVRARFGVIVIDLRQAVFTRREIVIEAASFCGKVEIVVPGNAQVYDTGTALFGRRSQHGRRDTKNGDGPVIRITGRSVLGQVRVVRRFKWPWQEYR